MNYVNTWLLLFLLSLIFTSSVYFYYYFLELNKSIKSLKEDFEKKEAKFNKEVEFLKIRCILYDILYNKYRSKNNSSPYILTATDLAIVKVNHNEECINEVAVNLDNLLVVQKGVKNLDKEEYL